MAAAGEEFASLTRRSVTPPTAPPAGPRIARYQTLVFLMCAYVSFRPSTVLMRLENRGTVGDYSLCVRLARHWWWGYWAAESRLDHDCLAGSRDS